MEKLNEIVNLRQIILDTEINYINRALYTTKGNIQQAANLLKVKRNTLSMRISGLGDRILMPLKDRKVYQTEEERKLKVREYNKKRKDILKAKELLKSSFSPFIEKNFVPVLKKKTEVKFQPLQFNPLDTVKHEGWTNKDTYLCARAIDTMSEHFIRKVILVSREGDTMEVKNTVLNLLDRSESDVKLKLVNVNFEEITVTYGNEKTVKIEKRLR